MTDYLHDIILIRSKNDESISFNRSKFQFGMERSKIDRNSVGET